MSAYNEYILAATLLDREQMFTLPVVLAAVIGEYDGSMERFAAGALVVSVACVALSISRSGTSSPGLTAAA